MNEFGLIREYFVNHSDDADILVNIGDDAAIVKIPEGEHLVTATDTLVNGRHFPENASPEDIAYRSLMTNLSDLAAMGAKPRWFTLNLTLPSIEPSWLSAFSQGLNAAADDYQVQLIGGDTTQGPLTISIQMLGHTVKGQSLKRTGTLVDDDIYVSGHLGDAAFALHQLNSENNYWHQAFYKPQPRIKLGQTLLSKAHSAIDISDGLIADLNHICQTSQVGAEIFTEYLPLSEPLREQANPEEAIKLALTGGDDYELCFTAPKNQREFLAELSQSLYLPLTRIGQVCSGTSVTVREPDGTPVSFKQEGFKHFDSED